jgi:hypothetical protein
MANPRGFSPPLRVERDLRLDLFRGIGLWMIFLDHIPDDVVSWLTLRNYGFSDAAEVFVFISGYLAGYIYGPIISTHHFLAAIKRLWKRAAEMYVAHIMLFLIFTAQIARTARKFDNPMYKDEFNVANFLAHPDILIGQALTLRYKPVDLDVLPLYIVLVAASPLILWGLLRRPNVTLLASILVYIGARVFDWNLASYPPGTHWYFNPFAWQLLFVFAAWCGVGGLAKIEPLIRSRAALTLAFAWIAVAGSHDPEMDDQGDLPDRQDRSRSAAAFALPRRGNGGHAVFPAQGCHPRLPVAAPADPVRSALAADFLHRGLPVLRSALGPDAVPVRRVGTVRRQLRRHGDHGRGGMGAGSGQKSPRPVRRRHRARG